MSESEQRRRTWLPITLSLGAATLVAVAVGVAIGAAVKAIDGIANVALEPFGAALDPIPIPATSCPYLADVHERSAALAAQWSKLGPPPGASSTDWPLWAVTTQPMLAQYDRNLRAAAARVPPELAMWLDLVDKHVMQGLDAFSTSSNASDYFQRSGVLDGYAALGHAGELVGGACGFELAPSLQEVLTPTSSTNTAVR